MKVATIAPYKEMEFFTGKDQFHLALAHFADVPGYLSFYQNPARGYVVLDNGAYEVAAGTGVMPDWNRMVYVAYAMKANELVLPDVMLDSTETFKLTSNALLRAHTDLDLSKMRLMMVPHGNDPREWTWCLHRMLWEFEELRVPGDLDPVIGIAKIYDTKFEHGRLGILQSVSRMLELHTFDVHLLGFTRLWQLLAIGKWAAEGGHEWVRSTDTGKAITYGIEKKLMSVGEAQVMHRQDDYFNLTLDGEQRGYALQNIEIINKAASGEYVQK